MALPKPVTVKESVSELRSLLKKSIPFFAPRIRMLLELQKHQKQGISKRELAELIGVDPNSTQKWRTIYLKGGIKALLSHNRRGYRPSVFTQPESQKIESKLKDPRNGLRGYTELLEWVQDEFGKEIKYNTLLKYCMRNFNSGIKVARKSHVNKNDEAVLAFKKTSRQSVNKQSKPKKKNSVK